MAIYPERYKIPPSPVGYNAAISLAGDILPIANAAKQGWRLATRATMIDNQIMNRDRVTTDMKTAAPKMSTDASLNALYERLVDFRDRRDWTKYHRPKDLALSVSIESAELLELFQWKTDDEIEAARAAGDLAIAASDEIALPYFVAL